MIDFDFLVKCRTNGGFDFDTLGRMDAGQTKYISASGVSCDG